MDGQSSSQPHEPGYGSIYKELGANESIGLEQKHWFWTVAGGGGVSDGSDAGWPSSSCSTNISCSFGVLSGSLGAKSFLASGKMISFLLGIPISFMISCFLQRIQYNQVTRVQQIADKGERTNIHAVYQNLITKNAIPRPLKNVAIGAFLCCKGDITGKKRTNKEKKYQFNQYVFWREQGRRLQRPL